MLNKLKEISSLIGKTIAEDEFPSEIVPEYLKEAVLSYPLRGGKRLRPAIMMWTCGMLGENPAKALYPAVATEIYHNWTLVHDDIIDRDESRRGQPSTHIILKNTAENKFGADEKEASKFGSDMAILAGDIQHGWAVNTLLRASRKGGLSADLTLALAARMQGLVNRKLISGEALDVEFSYRSHDALSYAELEKMLCMKTGALLRYCAETGAAIALNQSDFNHKKIKEAGDFAEYSGMAFQLKDDWLGIFGNPDLTGKPALSDLSEKKITPLFMATLERLNGKEHREFMDFYGKSAFSDRERYRIRELVRNSGAERAVLQKAAGFTEKARCILETFEDNEYRKLLFELTDYLTKREK